MASYKRRGALKAFTTLVLMLSLLFAFLLQNPVTHFSQQLLNIRSQHPCELTSELIDTSTNDPSLNGDQKKGGNDEWRVPVTTEQNNIHDGELQKKDEGREHDVIIDQNSEEHAIEEGSLEVPVGPKHDSNFTEREPLQETNQDENTLDASDQLQSKEIENMDKREAGWQEESDAEVELPPRLGPTLSHLQRSPTNPLTAPLEWKRPMMLSALATPVSGKLRLGLFSTGVNLIGFNRTLNMVGCLVGNKTYPKHRSDGRSPYYCLIDSDVPHGATITMLIAKDKKLDQAMAEPYVVGSFKFEVREEDLLKLDGNVEINKDVRTLSGAHEIVGIKSNITWHEGLREPSFVPHRKRYELCLMTAMRQYPFLMQQWFDYYRRMGVDQVYVYDNVSLEDLSKFDSEFVQTGFWPYGRSQFQSFNHFLLLARNRCKYVGFLDADEYIFVGDSKPGALKRYIKKWTGKGYDQITFPFIVMAGGGHIERPEGSLPNLYVRRDLRQNKFHVGKCIISTDYHYSRHLVHFAVGGRRLINSTFELNPTSLDHNAMLVHYTRRSWEEYIMKVNAGGASVMTHARAPGNSTLESVPYWYRSNDSTAEYLTFRDQWRTIMERKAPKDVSLVWESHGEECKQRYCIACADKKLTGKAECISS